MCNKLQKRGSDQDERTKEPPSQAVTKIGSELGGL